ncbi:MAG: hypothetical protein HZA58_00410 [Acidimicrobiia bacterium]|nr:hypothetical protein [Acidimicrobiia bacterium]
MLLRGLSAMGSVGKVLLWGAVACLAGAVLLGGEARGGLVIGAIVLGSTGFMFSVFGKAMGRLSGMTDRMQQVGIPGTATIVAVGDSRVTINNDPVVKFVLDVVVGDGIPYRVETRQLVSRVLIGAVVPGAKVAVRVDPDRREDVAIDWSQQAQSPAAASPLAGGKVGSAAELLASGSRGTAVITAMQDMGDISDLGYVGADAEAADDRIGAHSDATTRGAVTRLADESGHSPEASHRDALFVVQLEVKLPGRDPYTATVGHRVPERLVGRVGPRTTVDVAVGRGDDQEVAIDWDSVPG